MALTRWQPFQELSSMREAMDRLFAEGFLWLSHRWDGVTIAVPMDVYEEADEYVVEAA